MIKLKKIKLQNYCGYKNFELDLSDEGGVKRWAMFYGPNGIGKSNLLQAVELLASPKRLESRLENNLFLRKLTYHPNYNPTYIGFDKNKTDLYMEAVFLTDDGDKKIILENNWDDKVGITLNEFPPEVVEAASFIDADKPINLLAFQIPEENKDDFLDMAEVIYGFDCELPRISMVREKDRQTKKDIDLYTDFVLTKYGDTTVHYKSFSDGEKKIATLLSNIFRRTRNTNILLIDNIEMHIYFKRHMRLLEKLEEIFKDVQIIATTHSAVIVEKMDKKYLCDLEEQMS